MELTVTGPSCMGDCSPSSSWSAVCPGQSRPHGDVQHDNNPHEHARMLSPDGGMKVPQSFNTRIGGPMMLNKTVGMTFRVDGWDLNLLGLGEDRCFHCILIAFPIA
jgi:hypothetical protein